MKKALTLKEACKHLGVHPNTLRKWADTGKIKSFRFGKRGDRRFNVKDIAKITGVVVKSDNVKTASEIFNDWEKHWDKQYGKYLLAVDGVESDEKAPGYTINRSAKDFIISIMMEKERQISHEYEKMKKVRNELKRCLDWCDWYLDNK
jgi:excisionase family DNA binding protein